jgi:predicted AlkP superfamily pyrophosphatase or phosphodiesterase
MLKKNHISIPILLSGLSVLSVHARNYVEKASAESPNLIFIISDQLRFDALSCMGNKLISTPNMDRLAAEGVIFTRAYAQSPVSVPSRASMLTAIVYVIPEFGVIHTLPRSEQVHY